MVDKVAAIMLYYLRFHNEEFLSKHVLYAKHDKKNVESATW